MQNISPDTAIRKHYKKCRHLGELLSTNFELEPIHQFRVETKRLRALLRLAGSARHPRLKPKLPANLKVFYTMTGVIRTFQLQKKALEDVSARLHQGTPANCIALLNDRILSAESMLRTYLLTSSPFGKEMKGWHIPMSSTDAASAREAFIAAKITAITPDPAALADENKLHAIRKAMKDLLYAWPFLSHKDISHALPHGMASRKKLENTAALLGNLLDINMCLSLLADKQFLLCTCPHSATFLEAAGKCWLRDKQALLSKINASFLSATQSEPSSHSSIDTANAENRTNPLSPLNLSSMSYELHID